jgi:integrase/recombinase XerC
MCVGNLEPATIQAWMDSMAAADLALGAMRIRQSTLSSLCAFLVKRGHLDTNPVARLDRPPHRREAPRQVPGSAIMDALVKAARHRQRPRDLAIFLILRYSGMRRESAATLRVRNLDRRWGLRNVPVKGGKTRDIPLPAAVMEHLDRYATQYLTREVDDIKPDTPLFWSMFGQRRQGLVRRPMEGKTVWRLCKTYGRLIGYPMLKPHDLRHGVAMEVHEQHGDLEQVRGLLGHTRIETTQIYAQIRPAALRQAVEFYEAKALDVLSR